jgi:capsular polysaccharide transport system permease protein
MVSRVEVDPLDQDIELVNVRPTDVAAPGRMSTDSSSRYSDWKSKLPMLLAAIPSVLTLFYFALLSTGRFESEATFVVRSPSGNAMSQIANLVQGSGIISSADDAYVVHEYMESRDALQDLLADSDLMAVFHRSGWDPLWAVPGFFRPITKERLYAHYKRFISISFDKTTGISTLKVQAFRPDDARRIAIALLQRSEILLNRLNERAEKDAVVSAERQVEDSKRRAYDAQGNVTEFRNRESVIDPTLLSTAVVETVARLSLEMAELDAQLAELQTSSPANPQIGSIKLRLTALDNQIAKERSELAGTDASLAPRIAEYERLVLEREFADRAFVSALSTLEVARVDAQRQRTFLEQITTPNLPDYPKYPHRLFWIVVIVIGTIAAYWILRNVAIDIVSHTEI